jgi:hypothetical protein
MILHGQAFTGRIKESRYILKKLFTEAKTLYDSAMVNWQKENMRFIFVRNYERWPSLLKICQKSDQLLITQSADNKSQKAKNKNRYLILLTWILLYFNDYPLLETRTRYQRARCC